MSGDAFARHALRLQRERTAFGAGNGEPLRREAGHQKAEKDLRLAAFDAAIDSDCRVGKLARVAGGLGEDGDIRAAGLALHLDRSAGGIALAHRGEPHMQIERGEACELLRLGHAVTKPKELARHFQPVGGHGLQREIDLARRRIAQALDAAVAVERDGARRGEVEALDVEGVLGKAEFRVEPPGGNVGKQKLADAQSGMNLIVAERCEQALLGHRRKVRLLRIGIRQPVAPGRALAHHLAQIEAVAVEGQIDDAPLAAAIMQGAAEFRAAQLAACVVKHEVAGADGGLGGEA